MTIWGIVENLCSDAIFIVIAIVTSWIWITLTNRRKLQQFFNTSITKRLVIYLSLIRVLPFGTIGISGKKLSYQGHAVAYGEMRGASKIKDLFSFIVPKLVEVSQTIGKLFLSDVAIQTIVSPMEEGKLETQASFIAFGSSAYNVASAHIEGFEENIVKFRFGSEKIAAIDNSKPNPIAFSDTDPGVYTLPGTVDVHSPRPVTIPSGVALDPEIFSIHSELLHNAVDAEKLGENTPSAILVEGVPPITDTTYGFVERIIDSEYTRALFYVAGLSEFSTAAASHYLAAQWLSLYGKYGANKSFIIMLRFDPSDFEKWSVVFERELN